MSDICYSLGQLAEMLGADCVGDPEIKISGLATLASATTGHLSFLANPKYQKALSTTTASAVIVSEDMVAHCPCASLVSSNPYLTYANVSQLFAKKFAKHQGVHPSADIHSTASIDTSATIGAHVSVGANVSIGANTILDAGVVIGDDSVIGKDCHLYSNVTVYHGVVMGDRVSIHSSTVIGSDGFGYAPSPDREQGGWVKIAQLGGVRIGNDVEIGAATTIDRGALDDTVIGDRVIIDNQVQIAHNVEIGENTGIAACTGISGSTRIGKNCTLAGGVGLVGHITIADNVHVTGMTMVTKSIDKPGAYSSGTPMMETRQWKKSAVRFAQLDAMSKRLGELEKKN